MKIRVRCDCGKKLVAAGELAGKKTKCPACGAVIRLPLLDEASEQPASFLVTETGLNLTDNPQENCSAPAEEMPHPFNFSALEQAAAGSPEDEESHGVSDSSNMTNDRRGRELSTFPELWAAFIAVSHVTFRSVPVPMQFAAGAAATIAAGVMLWFVGWLMFPTSQKRNAGNESTSVMATTILATEKEWASGTGVKLSVLVNALNATPPERDESRSHDFVFANSSEDDRPRVIYGDTQSQLMLTGYGDSENLDKISLMMGVDFFSEEGGEGAAAFDRCVQRITATVDPSWVGEVSDSWNRNMFRLFKGPGIVMESHKRGLTARAVTIDLQDSPWVMFSIGPSRSNDRRQEVATAKSKNSEAWKATSVSGVQLGLLMTYMNFPPPDLASKYLHRFVLRDRQEAGGYRTYGDLHSALQLFTSGQTNDLKAITLVMRHDEFLKDGGTGPAAFGRCVQRMTAAIDESWIQEVYDALNQNIPRLFLDPGQPIVRQRRGRTASFVVKDNLIQFTIEISGRDAGQAR